MICQPASGDVQSARSRGLRSPERFARSSRARRWTDARVYRGGAPRILIVDDDDNVRVGLARALSSLTTCEVDTARDAFEAGYKLAQFRPDLVLLDVVMPGMGGLDVCARMRRLAGSEPLRIVILTGYDGSGHNERSLISGADLFLTKPMDVDEILRHVKDLLEG